MMMKNKLLAGLVLFPLSMVLAAPVYADETAAAGYQGDVPSLTGKQPDLATGLQPGTAIKMAAGDSDEQAGKSGDDEAIANGAEDESGANGENGENGEKSGSDHQNEGGQEGNN